MPHFGLLPNIKRWSLQVTQKGGNWERRKMVAPSFRTYVKDDLPTPKTSRWFIDMRIETDPNKSMSVATQRMNASYETKLSWKTLRVNQVARRTRRW